MYQFPHIDYNDHILCIELLPIFDILITSKFLNSP